MNNTLEKRFFETLTLENAAVLLIDHQAGLFLGVQSIDQQILKSNVISLAKLARILDLPTILFTSSSKGPNGPTIPEVRDIFPEHEIYDRSPNNLWDDPRSREAVEKTGRTKLIMAAISSDVCLAFPALSATLAGYDVYAVMDASGTWSTLAELATMFRLTQAGVKCTNWISVAAELKHDNEHAKSKDINALFGERLGFHSFLSDIKQAQSHH